MARLPRLHAPDAMQYLVQRATTGRALLIDQHDVESLVELLDRACRKHGLALHAYALTPSEMHLLGTPARPTTMAEVLQSIGRAFVPRINRKADRAGALWERRYRSTIVDPDALLPVMRIVEAHAERGVPSSAMGLAASSHAHHVGLRQDASLTDHAGYWALSDTPFERQAMYRDLTVSPLDPAFVERVRQAVEHGWALGSPTFVAALEQIANRRARPLPRGRPRKCAVVSPLIPDMEGESS